VGSDLRWSVRRGQLEASTVSKPVLESSSGLLGVLFGSRAFLEVRWTMAGSVLVEVASWGHYLATTPSHMGS
jgi:hypothetical protein